MARIDSELGTLHASLLVYGPRRSGKSSLLATLRNRLERERIERDGGTVSEAPLLDWLPLDLGRVGDWRVRIDLFAVTGTAAPDATRRMLLNDADGLLMVCDSQASRLDDNVQVLRNLGVHLQASDGSRRDPPRVFCYSKQDLPAELVLTREALDGTLNPEGAPSFAVNLLSGRGALDPIHALVRMVLRRHGPASVGE